VAAREWQRRPGAVGPEPPAGIPPRALVWVALLALAVGAGAGFAAARLVTGAEPRSGPAAALAAPAAVRTHALDPFLVNLVADGAPRYLRARIVLELDGAGAEEALAAHEPQVRDAVIGLLSSRDFADATRFEGRALLKRDLRERVNAVLPGGGVRDVLFTELVAQ